MIVRRSFFLSLLFLLICNGFQAWANEDVRKVRLGVHPDKTRFVMETTASTEFNVFTLSDPDRVIVDLKGLDWSVSQEEPSGGLIKDYRHGALNNDTLRVVLDTQRPVVAKARFIAAQDGFGPRFVLDMSPADGAERTSIPLSPVSMTIPSPPQPAQPIAEPIIVAGVPIPPVPPTRRPTTTSLPVIVLDAGHGGIDPGAIGIGDIHEKDITLHMAHALKEALEKTGQYKVVLTRDTDIFIPLRERFAKARAAGANLFVSLHADSIGKRDVRGLSVYTLSKTASDREAAMLADKENRVDEIAGVPIAGEDDDVASILIDLAQRDTMNKSRIFAKNLVTELDGDIILLRSPLRSAGFAVLKAPDVPSVLIEMGYLSSPKDSRMLNSGEHHKHLAEKIAQAIDTFFEK